jgi:lipoprotein signal peptidase
LKHSIGLPFEIAGSPLVSYVVIGVLMLGLMALVAAGGVGRPLHGVAVGFLLGTAASSLFDYIRAGSVENYIRIELGPHTVFRVNLALVAVAFSASVLMIAALAGSFPAFWQRRRSTAGQ